MRLRKLRVLVALIVPLATVGCGGGGGSNPPTPRSQTISFAQPGPLSVTVGSTLTNVASGGGGTGAITYQSSNSNVLSVNATSGVATGSATGNAIVTATKAADAGFSQAQATYSVNVQGQVQTISFAQPGPLSVTVDSTLTNVASGGGGTGAITYQSSDTNVLTVDATTGVATGVTSGAATVTATKAADAGFSQAQATYSVNVQRQVQTISFAQPGPQALTVGSTLTNLASGGGGTGAITYQSSDTNSVTINATTGVAAGVAVGTATVTATKAADARFSQAQTTYFVNVQRQLQTISFAQPGPLSLAVGSTLTNLASGGGGTGAITYQSSDTNVLTVNTTTGVAAGIAIGAVTVTATKALDPVFAQAQATYTINVQTTAQLSAWIGATNTQVTLPQLAIGKQFVRAPVATCTTPADIGSCPNGQSTGVATRAATDTTATLTRPAYYGLTAGSVAGAPTVVAAKRFSARIGHTALFFNERYWVIGGGIPQLPNAGPTPHTILADIWSSVDGKSWKLETDNAPFGSRWFHQAVVHNGEMWVISGASTPNNFLTDVWSSPDGLNWTRRTTNMGLPWYSTHLNVVVFNGAMWAVSGGRTFSSTDGVTWTPRSALGAIAGNSGRGYASLNVYNGSLWYIAGSPGPQAAPADVVNDVWKSSNGITWTQATGNAPFAKRMRHVAFVMDGRLWVFGGQLSNSSSGTNWALDAWSTTDGAQWTQEPSGGLDASYLAKVVEQTGPERVTLIGGIQRGYSNNVAQTTDGLDWTTLSTNAQFSPRTACGVSFNGQLWIIGGGTGDSNSSGADSDEIWRSANGIDWIKVTTAGTIFSPRDGHRVVVFQNKLWVIGGWDNSTGAGGTETRLNDVWSSSDGVAWTKHDPAGGVIFAPRVGHDVAVFANQLWVIGGSLQNADANDVWSSPDGVTWTLVQVNAAFSPRRSPRVVAFANELWLTSGGTTQGTSDAWHSPDGVTWTQVNPSPPFPQRLRHESAVLNGRMYVVGGVSGEDYLTSTLYNDVWSTADGTTWTQDAVAAEFSGRWHPALIAHAGEFWLAGGFGLSFFNEVWRSSDGVSWRLGFTHDIAVP